MHLSRRLSRIGLQLHFAIKIPKKPRLPRQNRHPPAAPCPGSTCTGFSAIGLIEHLRPIRDIRIQQLIPRPIHRRVARTKHPLLRQPHITISWRMPPPQKKKIRPRVAPSFNTNLSPSITFRGRSTLLSPVARTSSRFSTAACHRTGSHRSISFTTPRKAIVVAPACSPHRIAIRVIPMRMCIEHISHRLRRQPFHTPPTTPSLAPDNSHPPQLDSLHLNNRRIAVPLSRIPQQKPHSIRYLERRGILPEAYRKQPSSNTESNSICQQSSGQYFDLSLHQNTKTAQTRGLCDPWLIKR